MIKVKNNKQVAYFVLIKDSNTVLYQDFFTSLIKARRSIEEWAETNIDINYDLIQEKNVTYENIFRFGSFLENIVIESLEVLNFCIANASIYKFNIN